MPEPRVVLDTNVFVAAAFKPQSDSARVVAAVRDGRLIMPWAESTRDETEHVLRKIPRLRWSDVAGLFLPQHRHDEPRDLNAYAVIPDPADRKFAALAAATGAVLITADRHCLEHRGEIAARICTPSEFLRDCG